MDSRTPETSETEGWHRPQNSRKYHYYRDHRSLCGATLMFYSGTFQVDDGPSPDDCASCRRKLDKEKQPRSAPR